MLGNVSVERPASRISLCAGLSLGSPGESLSGNVSKERLVSRISLYAGLSLGSPADVCWEM